MRGRRTRMPDKGADSTAKKTRSQKRAHQLAFARASAFKRQTFYALENVAHAKLPAKIVGAALFVLIVLNAIVVFISAQPGLDPIATRVISVFYTFSTLCFFVEYLARIWIADLAFGDCSRTKARLRYICSPLGIIDLLSFAPNMVAWFVPMTPELRTVVNVVRLVRLVKISRYMRGLRTIGRVLEKRKSEIVASFLVLALLIVVASVVMYEIEHPAQPDKFNNLLSGIYWAVTTITATGYGDLVPITPWGRIVGSAIMFLSVALVAIPGGIFSAGFVAEFQNASLRRIERDVDDGDVRPASEREHGRGGESPSDPERTGERSHAPASASAAAPEPEPAQAPGDGAESLPRP